MELPPRPPLAKIYPDVTPDLHEPNTFIVQSRWPSAKPGKRGPYTVRLEEYNWNGWCACFDFQYHHLPELEAGAWPSDAHRCYHIKRARAYRLDELGPVLDQARLALAELGRGGNMAATIRLLISTLFELIKPYARFNLPPPASHRAGLPARPGAGGTYYLRTHH